MATPGGIALCQKETNDAAMVFDRLPPSINRLEQLRANDATGFLKGLYRACTPPFFHSDRQEGTAAVTEIDVHGAQPCACGAVPEHHRRHKGQKGPLARRFSRMKVEVDETTAIGSGSFLRRNKSTQTRPIKESGGGSVHCSSTRSARVSPLRWTRGCLLCAMTASDDL